MKKLISLLLILAANSAVFSQFINSVQIQGGMIFPSASQNGLLTAVAATHNIDSSWSLYSSSGYSYFNKNSVFTDYILGSRESYSEDSHKLYKITLGSELILNRIKSFKIFADFELSYNHLSYNEYEMILITDDVQRKVLAFQPDYSTRKLVTENLAGFGFGLGFTQQLSSNYAFSLEYKRLVQTKNMDYFRHYYALSLGLVYNL